MENNTKSRTRKRIDTNSEDSSDATVLRFRSNTLESTLNNSEVESIAAAFDESSNDSIVSERTKSRKQEEAQVETIQFLTQDYKKKASQLEKDIKCLKEKIYRKGLEKAVRTETAANFVKKHGILKSAVNDLFDFESCERNKKLLTYAEDITKLQFTNCTSHLDSDGEKTIRNMTMCGLAGDVQFETTVKLVIPGKQEEEQKVGAEVVTFEALLDEVTFNELHDFMKQILESNSVLKFFQEIVRYSDIRRTREQIYEELKQMYSDLIHLPDGSTGTRIQFFIGTEKKVVGEVNSIVESTPLMTLTERLEFNILVEGEVTENTQSLLEAMRPNDFNKLVDEFHLLGAITLVLESVLPKTSSSDSSN